MKLKRIIGISSKELDNLTDIAFELAEIKEYKILICCSDATRLLVMFKASKIQMTLIRTTMRKHFVTYDEFFDI